MNATVELLKAKANLALKTNALQENELLELLGNEIPEINGELEKLSHPQNVYRSVQCFADFTKQLIRTHNLPEVKHCFLLAEKMLKEGNVSVKNAIENVYVFSMSSFLSLSKEVNKLLPTGLKAEYYKQINAGGI